MKALKKIFAATSAKADNFMAGFAAKRGFTLLDSGDIRGALDWFAAYPAARQKRNGDGYTPLESLLYGEKWDFAQSYLSFFLDEAKTTGKDGTTLLMQYTAIEKTRAADLLLAHGAPVDAQDALGNTALHYCMHNDMDADMLPFARDLIRYGAKTDIPNAEGVTPLMLAAGNPALAPLLQLLLGEKADPARRDKAGLTAGMHALKECAFGNAELLGHIDIAHAAMQAALDTTLPTRDFVRGLKQALADMRAREVQDDVKKISALMKSGASKPCRVKTVTFRQQSGGG